MSLILTGVFAVGLTSICGYLGSERRRHNRNLNSIGTRVLVNGIRGKSSTTRLVAAGLRADPTYVVAAKTTGTAARMIYPNGHELPITRKHGVVNVIEQVGVVETAARVRATHLVLECMAVDPELQRLNQEVLVRSQIGVITNVRMDHVDEMGPSLRDIARSLSGGMPIGGICVTAEDRVWRTLRREAAERDCTLIHADPESVSDAEMAPFPYLTFKGNVACALQVAELCGVPREIALASMYVADPDPGVLRVDLVEHEGDVFRAANLFAANDPESTVDNLVLLRDRGLVRGRLSVVINCRPDRIERNGQMGAIVEELGADRVFLIGAPTRSALHTIPARMRDRVIDIEGEHHTGEQLRELICARLFDDYDRAAETVVMVGNIHGRGEVLLSAFARQHVVEPRVRPKIITQRQRSGLYLSRNAAL
ncbi:poly-gamma-glutamate synthase PgsB [Actinoplanes sp. NBRC 103695]|uniref:poly-gamma-glutamate synthase PgsB n=1 Tax=Actinoplanes sp. NBRC 103695 TaxID=3032202 RepID=UPI0024A434B7|nr:poly-gamma-glutamate synthase PgsB [Actinoplanes sp. NBRC 103695]GLZ01373.1 poly-gamma-glutamate synthase PgsB [Actinoplanes sp. NBRC 103695]